MVYYKKDLSKEAGKLFALQVIYQTKTFLIWPVQLWEGLPILFTCTPTDNPKFICMTY